jgi:chemotaxis protein methyltransferase WspC
MTLFAVDALVRERFGLDPESLGAATFPRAVELRMRATGVTTTEAYLGILNTDPAEQGALAAELVVPETWFFRGGRALFDWLAEFVANRSGNRPADTPVRVLSVPCSTGEEPYSLAVALQEHMVHPETYQIAGVDLSEPHLARARAGQFTPFAFRETGTDIRPTYFQSVNNQWELRPSIRHLVQFRAANVIDPAFLDGESPYDLILCRNLFIYLTADARRRAMANLDRLLAMDGVLCLTAAEADRLPPNRFVATGPPEFSSYRRVGVGSALHAALAPSHQATQTARAETAGHGPTTRVIPQSNPLPTPQQPIPPAREGSPRPAAQPHSVEAARELADMGRLAAARDICERLLAQSSGDPNVHTLLGVIHLAEGRAADAAEEFRKALYLDPNNPDALSHMIVICDHKGDTVQAAALRKRLVRAMREKPS